LSDDAEGPARVFVGIGLGAELGARAMELVATALGRRVDKDWRLPRADGLHLTLAFLGDVPRELLEPLGAALAAELEGRPSPRLLIRRTGAFPERGAERVLWLGIDEDGGAASGRLTDLRRRSFRAVAAAGIDASAEERRPFEPHVTVARPRRRSGKAEGRAPAAFFALEPELELVPTAVELFESRRVPDGPPVYAPIASVALAPR